MKTQSISFTNIVIKSTISTIVLVTMILFSMLCYNLGYVFWSYFNLIISGTVIYLLCIKWFSSQSHPSVNGSKNEQL